MVAVTIVSLGWLPLQLALGICLGLAIGLLIAHLANPKVKRCAAALLVAIMLVPAVAAVARASDGDDSGFVILDPCKGHTSSDWEWWLNGCMWPLP